MRISNLSAFTAVFGVVGILSATASADSVLVVTKTTISGQAISSQAQADFRPTSNTITVNIAGKTCTFGSSTQGSVPQGCNYTITVDENDLVPSVREASSVCMQIPMKCN